MQGKIKNLLKSALILGMLFLPSSQKAETRQNPIAEWQKYEISVRDGLITKNEAALKLEGVTNSLSSYILSNYKIDGEEEWAFPFKNSSIGSIEKGQFKPDIIYGAPQTRGYDFLDGNKHGGHPAYDFFVLDKNFDSLDDRKNKPIEVVSVEDAVVISTNNKWDKNNNQIFDKDDIRGGKYIWSYNPKTNKFFYYAHLNEIFVKPGDAVKKGMSIATVGRTGSTAVPKEERWDKNPCPTHLHFMVLEKKMNKLVPFDYYPRYKK